MGTEETVEVSRGQVCAPSPPSQDRVRNTHFLQWDSCAPQWDFSAFQWDSSSVDPGFIFVFFLQWVKVDQKHVLIFH